jgi:hypothetical protein
VDSRVGDKVRLKDERSVQGIVERVDGGHLLVRLAGSKRRTRVSISKVTNLSLAARKAWQRMPARRVGRPKGSRLTDRISVTLRIDRAQWENFRRAEKSGLIMDRTATINEWIGEGLTRMTRRKSR